MNYSQRKHLERLMAGAPSRDADPFGLTGTFGGMKVVESPDVPRYTLPAEVMPGVPWPAGFRSEINNWSRAFLGTTNVLPRGKMYLLGGHTVVMNPRDVVLLSGI